MTEQAGDGFLDYLIQQRKDKTMAEDKQKPPFVNRERDRYDLTKKTYDPTIPSPGAPEEPPLRAFDIPEPFVGLGASGDPKGEAGAAKPGLGNISVAAQYYEGAVMQQGGETYGFYNWCEHPMRASTYYEAILRHLNAWWTGQTEDPKSKFPHMAHIRASAGIIIDQQEADRMIDDRPKNLADINQVWDKITHRLASNKAQQAQDLANLEELEKGLKELFGEDRGD